GYVGAAFELLPRGYYELPENKARSRLLSKPQWRQVAEALVTALAVLKQTNATMAEQLASIEQGLTGLNKVSGSRLNSIFLTELGLRTGDTERRALQARNDAAHANRLETSDFEALRAYR